MKELKIKLYEAIKENDLVSAKQAIDDIVQNWDESFYQDYDPTAGANNFKFPVFAALYNGADEIFNYMRVKLSNLDLGRAISAKTKDINVSEFPCRTKVNNEDAIDEEKLQKAHNILKILNDKMTPEQKVDSGLLHIASYFLDVQTVKSIVEDKKIFKESANKVFSRDAYVIDFAAGGLDKDDRYRQIYEILINKPEIKQGLGNNDNYLNLIIDTGELQKAKEFIEQYPQKISLSSLMALNGCALRESKSVAKDKFKNHFADVLGLTLNKLINDKNNFEIIFLSLEQTVESMDFNNPDVLKTMMQGVAIGLSENLKSKNVQEDVYKFTKGLLNNDFFKEPLEGLLRININELDDFAMKLDRSPNIREELTKNKDLLGGFESKYIEDKLIEIESSRGFFGRIYHKVLNFIYPLGKSAFKNNEIYKKFNKGTRNLKKDPRELYKEAHKEVVLSNDKEKINERLSELEKVKEEFEKTTMIVNSTMSEIDSKQTLRELNIKFLELMASPASYDKNRSDVIKEVRTEYLSKAFSADIAKSTEDLYSKWPAGKALNAQTQLIKSFQKIQGSKDLSNKDKELAVEKLTKKVTDISNGKDLNFRQSLRDLRDMGNTHYKRMSSRDGTRTKNVRAI